MPDAGLCDSGVGKCLNPLDRSTQHNAFHAIVMIQVDVQGRDVEVVVCVMALCQTAREVAFVMVEDVGQVSQAVATRLLCQFLLVHALAYQVPDRFGTVLVAVVRKIFLEVFYQIIVQRDGHSLHVFSPVTDSMRMSGYPHEFRACCSPSSRMIIFQLIIPILRITHYVASKDIVDRIDCAAR